MNTVKYKIQAAWKAVLIVLFVLSASVTALENGLARTPPMGWNSWNHFACDGIKEELFKQMVDAMVDNGMKEAGYEYLNIDDCWSGPRNAIGDLTASEDFTDRSLKTLADYVHSKSLKIGTYSCAGTATCQNYPGSYGYEEQDAAVFAEWGIDYLKHDFCNTTDQEWWRPASREEGVKRYTAMRDAIIKAGRPMVFSICEWGSNDPWEWGEPIGNMWRTTNDIALGWDHVRNIIESQVDLWRYSGPGAWNDPDMLEVGRGLTVTEDQTHFGMWCMFAATLIMGNALRNMSQATLDILTHREAIAVDQDTLGIQAQRIRKDGDLQVWVRPLMDNGRAVALYNSGSSTREISFSMADLNRPTWEEKGLEWTADMSAPMREIWSAADLGAYSGGTVTREVPGHGMAFITIRPAPETGIPEAHAVSVPLLKITVQADFSCIHVTAPFAASTPSRIEVYNTGGEAITSVVADNASFSLPAAGLENGVYVMRVSNAKQTVAASFIMHR